MTETRLRDRLHSAGRRDRAAGRGRQGLRRRGRPRRRTGARSVVVERARQAQYRPVRCGAPAGAGRDRVEPGAWPRQGADRGAVRARRERQCHHRLAALYAEIIEAAADGDIARSDGVGARAGARGRRRASARRRAAHLRHDVSVLDPQLSAALLDGGRRRRSRRGRAPRGAAAALHGGEPRQRACRRLLRRRAVELGRGRSRHRPHPAFRRREILAARRREGAGGARALGGGESRCAGTRWCAPIATRRRLSSRTSAIATRSPPSWPRRIASASSRGDPPHARRPPEGRARRQRTRATIATC